jgi:hypothetical protein
VRVLELPPPLGLELGALRFGEHAGAP